MTPYVRGDAALDALLGVDRAEAVEIVSGEAASPAQLRAVFGIAPERVVQVVGVAPQPAVVVDRLALLADGSLIDQATGEAWDLGPDMSILRPDLSTRDIVRLFALRRRYPELQFPLALVRRLSADVAHLASISADHPDVAAELLAADLDTFVITS